MQNLLKKQVLFRSKFLGVLPMDFIMNSDMLFLILVLVEVPHPNHFAPKAELLS